MTEDAFAEWVRSLPISHDAPNGFPYHGGWVTPYSYASSINLDGVELAERRAWIDEQCPGGPNIDYKLQTILCEYPIENGRYSADWHYVWFADEITATLYRLRF